MKKMQQYMVVHCNPGIDCKVVQANWRKMAKLESTKWVRTYINEKKGDALLHLAGAGRERAEENL